MKNKNIICAVLIFFFGLSSYAQTWSVYNTSNSNLPGNTVNGLDIGNAQNLWIAISYSGVVKFDGDTSWTIYDTLPINTTWYAIEVDSKGDIWVGGDNSCQLFKYDGSNWIDHTSAFSSNGDILSIKEDENGNIWVGYSYGLKMFDGISWTDYSTNVSAARVYTLEADNLGKLWVGTSNDGVFSYDGTNWINYNYLNSPLPQSQVRSLAKAEATNMWIGTRAGIVKFDGDTTWNLYSTSNSGLPDDDVYGISVDADTIIWTACSGGGKLGKFDGNSWTTNIYFPFNSVTFVNAIVIDQSGNKWVGGQGGLVKYADGGSGPFVYTGMDEEWTVNENMSSLTVFPNPFNSSTTIRINSGLNVKNTVLEIYNLLGQEVKKIAVIENEEIKIQRGALLSGIYFFQLTNNNLIIGTKKVIIE